MSNFATVLIAMRIRAIVALARRRRESNALRTLSTISPSLFIGTGEQNANLRWRAADFPSEQNAILWGGDHSRDQCGQWLPYTGRFKVRNLLIRFVGRGAINGNRWPGISQSYVNQWVRGSR